MKHSAFIAILIAALGAFALPSQVLADLQSDGAPDWEIALGVGSMQLKKGRMGIDDTGMALNLGIRFSDDSTPVDAELRFYGTASSLNDSVYFMRDDRGNTYDVYCNDCDYTIIGTDFSLLLNFDRGAVLNPYIGVGVVYEGSRFAADIYEGNYHYGWPRHPEADWEEHGATYLFRAGVDFREGHLYARFDAGFIGQIYDDDDSGQVVLNGDCGIYLCPEVRAEVFGHYFTEYQSHYIGIGLTVVL